MQRTHMQLFFAAFLISVAVIASVVIVYAVLIATYYGGNVTVNTATGSVWYDDANSTSKADWTATLGEQGNIGNGSAWYVKLNITTTGYSGNVNITWTLQNETSPGVWSNVPDALQQTNDYSLTGVVGQEIFASSDGNQSTNKNWGIYSNKAGTYRVKAVIVQS